ncbi:MAG: efflux RND transporter periplasmic adaptor subunit, partial [Mycobacterium sp.]|nr:efflux RND transporter periplasmic adaptor subunit [Mycobacterium sp.]
MNDLAQPSQLKPPPPRPLLPAPDHDAPETPSGEPPGRGGSGGRLLGLGALLLFIAALGLGVWRHYQQHRQVMDTAEQQADFVPTVRVQDVTQRLGTVHVTLPATTLGFEAANIYARASGYVAKRYVDIGDHVKAGELLAEITAPEIEAQVAQYQNSLQQAHETTGQNQAQQALAGVTWGRDSVLVKQGWVTYQQGDVDRYSLQAQQHATQAAHFNTAAMQAQLSYFNQQKIYQQVVSPFDGVITQRNIDVGSLITADASGGTSMFSLQQSDVIRIWVYVPQDSAFGVKPGVEAVIRVPAMPNLTFDGKVTRIADALQPGTRTLLTEVDVPNPDGALQPGVYCTVELKIPRTAPALIVPASAIIFNQNGMQVAVVENGIVHLHKIAITTDYGTEVEVNAGIKAGDQVILQPPVNLADGDKVNTIN